MISERISDDIPFEYSYSHSNAQVTFLLKNDCENVMTVMTPSLRQYIAGYTVANL